MFYGREEDFALVKKRFHDSDRGAILIFCGERRSGKTSILFQIMDGRLGEGFISVLLDMQSMAVENEADFLHRIAREVSLVLEDAPLDIEESGLKGSSNPAGIFRDYIESEMRRHPGKKLVLLFDEYELLENKIDSGVLSEDVLLVLANLIENNPVYLIFTGSQALEERSKPYWRILGASEFRRISFLHPRDTVRLITEPVAGRVEYEPGTVESISRLTAGQPFYTQAVCQKIVDTLNEAQTSSVSEDILDTVTTEIIDNPFPQMTFMWDTLEFDERFALSILAEALADGDDTKSASDLAERRSGQRLPVAHNAAQIATALESLFQSELLMKSDDDGFSFRMDIWRGWVRRMHSPWQVLREEGVDVRQSGRRRRSAWMLAMSLVLVVAAVVFWRTATGPESSRLPAQSGQSTPLGRLSIRAVPAEAEIYRDGVRIAGASYDTELPADSDFEFLVRADEYYAQPLTVRTVADSTTTWAIELAPMLGSVRFTTSPPGADLSIDGTHNGKSPLTVEGLKSALLHTVRLEAPGYFSQELPFSVRPDTLIDIRVILAERRSRLGITSYPAGASVALDGVDVGSTPLQLNDVELGDRHIRSHATGFVPLDTVFRALEEPASLHLELVPLPVGTLIVQGDLPALIYIGDNLVKQGYVQNSGPYEVQPGTHMVRVVLTDGSGFEESIEVASGERVTFDFSSRQVTIRARKQE